VNAAEEMVRFEPSVVGTARQSLEDTVICDVPVGAGTPVQIALIAAGRDPLAYEAPDRFDIGRTDSQPINFGGGIHHCLGAALARAELQESILLLARRVRQVSLTATPAWVPYASIRRFDRLTVRLRLP
jgi:cytochrome P450 family 103